MKNGKSPTRSQKKLMQEYGLNAKNHLVVKNTSEYVEIVSRTALLKHRETGKKVRTRKLQKTQAV